MPKPLKPYVKVGTKQWEVFVPRPPRHASHARLTCFDDTYDSGKPKTATVAIRDFGTFDGVSGDFHYIRMNKQGKVLEEYNEVWHWDGKQVEGLEVDND